MSSFIENLTLLRALMKEQRINFYIIPSTDPHLGEHIPDHWRMIEWLTGFTGSAATVIVTDKFAGFWTDSRYFIHAERQLSDSGFILMNSALLEKKDFLDWMTGNID